jgi:hypothetical protein
VYGIEILGLMDLIIGGLFVLSIIGLYFYWTPKKEKEWL